MLDTVIDTLLNLLWAALPALITGVALAEWNNKQKEREDAADRREEERRRSEVVQLDLLVATAELARANAVALKDGHTNGEMKEGLRKYNEAIEKFREFERERLVE